MIFYYAETQDKENLINYIDNKNTIIGIQTFYINFINHKEFNQYIFYRYI